MEQQGGQEGLQQLQQQFLEAYEAGDFDSAFGKLVASLGQQIEAAIRAEGYELTWTAPPDGSFSYFAGLTVALGDLIEKEGEAGSYKLPIAFDLSSSVARLRRYIDELGEFDSKTVSKLLIQAFRIGVGADHLGLATTGLLDEFGELKFRDETLKAKQREAAGQTNAKRGTVRDRARQVAARLHGLNPRLPTEELALKIREELRISTSLRTIGDWIRGWRRSGQLSTKTER